MKNESDKMYKLLCATMALALVVSAASGFQQNSKRQQQQQETNQPEPEPYSFSYSAESNGGLSTHQESGDGSGRVTGFYTIQGEDGRERRVDYIADENGYRATIKTNEVGTRSESSANALYETQLPSAKQLEAAKISFEQYKYLEDSHQIERERSLRRMSSAKNPGQQQQNMNQPQLTSTTDQRQSMDNNLLETTGYSRQNQQLPSQLSSQMKQQERATGWQANSQTQQPKQTYSGLSSSAATQYNQQQQDDNKSSSSTVSQESKEQSFAPNIATPVAIDDLDWRQGRRNGAITMNSATMMGGQYQNNANISQTLAQMSDSGSKYQGQFGQWQRPNRPTTVLEKQLEQQFMLQATQLTEQDYPRQRAASNNLQADQQETSVYSQRPSALTWNANQQLVGGPYNQKQSNEIDQQAFNNQQSDIINEPVERQEYQDDQTVEKSPSGSQPAGQQPPIESQQIVTAQPVQQQYVPTTSQRIPQPAMIAMTLNEQAKEQPSYERPKVPTMEGLPPVTEPEIPILELQAGKLVGQEQQQFQQVKQQDGGEEVSVVGGEQDEMNESPMQQVNVQQQDTPSTEQTFTLAPTTTTTTTTTTQPPPTTAKVTSTTTTTTTTVSPSDEQETVQPMQPLKSALDEQSKPEKVDSVNQIIGTTTRQPTAAAGKVGAVKGSNKVGNQQPARFMGMLMRVSSTTTTRPNTEIPTTTMATWQRQEAQTTSVAQPTTTVAPLTSSTSSTTIRPAYVESSVEPAAASWQPAQPGQVQTKQQSAKGASLTGLRRMSPKSSYTTAVPVQKAPMTRGPIEAKSQAETAYTTMRPLKAAQANVYLQTGLPVGNRSSEFVNQVAPKLKEPQRQAQEAWKGVKGGSALDRGRGNQKQFWINLAGRDQRQQLASVNKRSALSSQSSSSSSSSYGVAGQPVTSTGATYLAGGQSFANNFRQQAKSLPGSRLSQLDGDSIDGFGYRVRG